MGSVGGRLLCPVCLGVPILLSGVVQLHGWKYNMEIGFMNPVKDKLSMLNCSMNFLMNTNKYLGV